MLRLCLFLNTVKKISSLNIRIIFFYISSSFINWPQRGNIWESWRIEDVRLEKEGGRERVAVPRDKSMSKWISSTLLWFDHEWVLTISGSPASIYKIKKERRRFCHGLASQENLRVRPPIARFWIASREFPR